MFWKRIEAVMTARYYLVTVETNRAEHQLNGLDQEVARHMRFAFGDKQHVSVLEAGAAKLVNNQTRAVLFDPVVHDGEEPPGYVPEWDRHAWNCMFRTPDHD